MSILIQAAPYKKCTQRLVHDLLHCWYNDPFDKNNSSGMHIQKVRRAIEEARDRCAKRTAILQGNGNENVGAAFQFFVKHGKFCAIKYQSSLVGSPFKALTTVDVNNINEDMLNGIDAARIEVQQNIIQVVMRKTLEIAHSRYNSGNVKFKDAEPQIGFGTNDLRYIIETARDLESSIEI